MYRERAQGFNTQPPEGGCITSSNFATIATSVSTHSRPKAAAVLASVFIATERAFQHTAARRRLLIPPTMIGATSRFQHTAARRRLLGALRLISSYDEFQHTAARRRLLGQSIYSDYKLNVSTHSRPKAAASANKLVAYANAPVSTHSRPKAAAKVMVRAVIDTSKFQHTAARRRLQDNIFNLYLLLNVSTHSRPKAAACLPKLNSNGIERFNTQPPEGGCIRLKSS